MISSKKFKTHYISAIFCFCHFLYLARRTNPLSRWRLGLGTGHWYESISKSNYKQQIFREFLCSHYDTLRNSKNAHHGICLFFHSLCSFTPFRKRISRVLPFFQRISIYNQQLFSFICPSHFMAWNPWLGCRFF